MLIHRQDISVLLLYFVGYSKIRNFFLRLQHKPVARFLTFHDLPKEAVCQFEANLHFLKRNTNVVSLDDFFSGRLSAEKINVVITFDDGFKHWVTNALPVLRKLSLPATFFVSSGFVGLSKENEIEFLKSKLLLKHSPLSNISSGLNSEDLKKLVEEGHAVGGHTLNHCILAKVLDSDQLRFEIIEDKLRLERMTGRKIEYFAYPSGAYHNPQIDIAKILQESGYRGALTTVSGFNTVETQPYLLHRELTRASMPGYVFRARVFGNYDAVNFLKRRLRPVFIKQDRILDKEC